jgi:hypothetical protein
MQHPEGGAAAAAHLYDDLSVFHGTLERIGHRLQPRQHVQPVVFLGWRKREARGSTQNDADRGPSMGRADLPFDRACGCYFGTRIRDYLRHSVGDRAAYAASRFQTVA